MDELADNIKNQDSLLSISRFSYYITLSEGKPYFYMRVIQKYKLQEVDYIYDNFDAFKPVICRSSGTKYDETVVHNMSRFHLDKCPLLYYIGNTEMYMTTVRLPIEYEQKLDTLSVLKKKTKSELIKEALDILFHKEELEVSSYELGKTYFGQYGSGRTDLSTTYKKELKERLHVKYSTH